MIANVALGTILYNLGVASSKVGEDSDIANDDDEQSVLHSLQGDFLSEEINRSVDLRAQTEIIVIEIEALVEMTAQSRSKSFRLDNIER